MMIRSSKSSTTDLRKNPNENRSRVELTVIIYIFFAPIDHCVVKAKELKDRLRIKSKTLRKKDDKR